LEPGSTRRTRAARAMADNDWVISREIVNIRRIHKNNVKHVIFRPDNRRLIPAVKTHRLSNGKTLPGSQRSYSQLPANKVYPRYNRVLTCRTPC
jgi:hypothetical protein